MNITKREVDPSRQGQYRQRYENDVLMEAVDKFADTESQQNPITRRVQLIANTTINRIHEILKPTLESFTRESTVAEVQERLYRKLLIPTENYNKCASNAFDLHDQKICEDNFVSFMENDMIQFTKDLAREY